MDDSPYVPEQAAHGDKDARRLQTLIGFPEDGHLVPADVVMSPDDSRNNA
jgi:hypothetical protein